MLKGYVTPVDVASRLGYSLDDTALMADVALMIEDAEAAVDDYCQTQFQPEDATTKLFNGAGHNMLTLGLWMRQLISVEIVATDGTAVALTDVVAQPLPLRRGYLYTWIERRQNTDDYGNANGPANVFPHGLGNIRVTADWGFTEATIPVAVKRAVTLAVKHFFDQRTFNDLIELEAGLGRTLKRRTDMDKPQLPDAAKALLDPWINRNFMVD